MRKLKPKAVIFPTGPHNKQQSQLDVGIHALEFQGDSFVLVAEAGFRARWVPLSEVRNLFHLCRNF